MGVNLKDMAEKMSQNKELIDAIEKNTTNLQNEDFEGGRNFTSYTVTGMEDGYPNTYCSIDSADMEQSITQLVDEIADENLRELFEKIRGSNSLRVAFSVTASKTHTTIRVIQGGEVSSTSTYTNVKSADDLLKLVSFHTAEFVDPMLKDFEAIKSIFGK